MPPSHAHPILTDAPNADLLPPLPLLPSSCIPQDKIHLRPGLPSDFPQCRAIFAHWVLYSVASMTYVVPSLTEFAEELEDCWKNHLPFIVAVCSGVGTSTRSPQDTAAVTANKDTEPDNNSPRTDKSTSDTHDTPLVLGYLFTLPLFPEHGHRIRLVEQGTFIHPDLRKSGIGSRLTALNLNLLKNPGRYTLPLSLQSTAGIDPKPLYPELDPTAYHAFRGTRLRPASVMVRRTVVDEEGVGKGKSRFFEKFGFKEVGYVVGAGVKDGKVWDLRFWGLVLEDWDEEKSMYCGPGVGGEDKVKRIAKL